MPVSKKRKPAKRVPRRAGNPRQPTPSGVNFRTLTPEGYASENAITTLCVPDRGSKDVIHIRLMRNDIERLFSQVGDVSEEFLVELSSIIYGLQVGREPQVRAQMNSPSGDPDIYFIDCQDGLPPFFICVPPDTLAMAEEWFTEWHINQIAPDPDDEEAREAAEVRVRGLGEKYVLPHS
jgi:hypothetical protein